MVISFDQLLDLCLLSEFLFKGTGNNVKQLLRP